MWPFSKIFNFKKLLKAVILLFLVDLVYSYSVLTDSNIKERNMHPPPVKQTKTKRSIKIAQNHENSKYFWNTGAQIKLRDQLLKQQNFNTAKNVILFLGDGMSIPTLAASRIYLGQLQGNSGEESRLFFEDFPYVGLSKTYCVDKQVGDSACTATAYLTGVKGNYGTIGVTGDVEFNNCESSMDRKNHVSSIAAWAQAAGKGTGIVTTTRVTHASPAGTYAHVGNREWECDADVKQYEQNPANCLDIASQLVFNQPGQDFKVILGGGRQKFLPKDVQDEEGSYGQRLDGANLINSWKKLKRGKGTYVYDKPGLLSLNLNETEYLLGLFEPSHLQYHLDTNHVTDPTLSELTVTAIKLLQKEKKGYFLFVEGGRIDHAHHDTIAHKALDETVEFAEAIRMATEITSNEDTLIVVTSDHAHTMSFSGYSNRGEDILGLNSQKSDVDSLPYTTLSYANGPGYVKHVNGTRVDLSNEDITDKNYKYPSLLPMNSETHGGDDVGVFALGPWSHLFTGLYEQNVIPHIIAYASCIGEGLTSCKRFSK